jgi:threonylcarbamoyladenosine tRNA methylthiotransferase MtaB
MYRVAFYTLGCKLNFSETSAIARSFEEHGFKKVDFEDTPDIFVINTCSVTENADRKCRKVIRDAQRVSANPYIIVVGCYAQLKPREIASIEGVDAVLGANEKFRILELINDFQKGKKATIFASDIEEATSFFEAYSINDRTRTFLKVQDGCDYACTFCTIPLARGRSRSNTIPDIVDSARRIADDGVREIVLTGVNTGDFGIRNSKRHDRFIDLIRALDQAEGIERFRISSIEPNLLTDEIIEFVASSNRFVPHFHIPLQSGADKILKKMRRRYLTPLYAGRVETIKRLMPHACIGVDLIVGFPGENRDTFMETYRFVQELDISYLHVFTYSERPNTPASAFDGAVSTEEKQERSIMLRSLSVKKRRCFYRQHLGEIRPVLFENDVTDGLVHGFTDNYIRVGIPHRQGVVNTIQPVYLDRIGDEMVLIGSVEKASAELSATS